MGKVLHGLENVLMTIKDLRKRQLTEEQKCLGKRLAAELESLAANSGDEAKLDFWKKICIELHQCAKTESPMQFMRWAPIACTMTYGTTESSLGAYRIIRRSPRWKTKWARAIRRADYGSPRPFLRDLSTNSITVQHASHLEHFLQKTGRLFLDTDCVIDLGAGYGSMCHLSRCLGYTGHYVIFDQPPILALQRYYLGLNGIGTDSQQGEQVDLCRDLNEVKEIASRFDRVGVISTWALSEMPLELRAEIEPLFSMAFNVLLAYQEEFEGISNRDQFLDLIARNPEFDWHHFEIEYQPKSHYVFGTRPR